MPALIRYNLPLDAIEGTIWGHQLQWGYDKNPFLNGWLTALAIFIGGQSGWMVYLFSQLSVITAFWVVWQLGRQILSPVLALIAVLLLEGIQYFNFHAIDFNDNTLELGLWSLTIYFFYRALHASHILRYWLALGLFAGLAMMAKYYTAALLAAMLLYLLIDGDKRQLFKNKYLYLALIMFFVITIPHVIWLFNHDFITVKYVFERTASKPSWTNHFVYPLQFTYEQFQALLPALLLFIVLLIGRKPVFAEQKIKLKKSDQTFLFYIGLGPFLLTLILALLFGIKLRAGWGMPLLTLWTLILLAYLQPHLTLAKLRRFLILILGFISLLLTGYYFSLTRSSGPTSANFPGKEIAQEITHIWQTKYHRQLVYVAGSRWVGGNIAFYSPNHPAVFIEWDKRRAPWIDLHDLEKQGAVFVWSITDNETIPKEMRQRYPQLSQTDVLEFAWKRNNKPLPPIKIGIAYLPPN